MPYTDDDPGSQYLFPVLKSLQFLSDEGEQLLWVVVDFAVELEGGHHPSAVMSHPMSKGAAPFEALTFNLTCLFESSNKISNTSLNIGIG